LLEHYDVILALSWAVLLVLDIPVNSHFISVMNLTIGYSILAALHPHIDEPNVNMVIGYPESETDYSAIWLLSEWPMFLSHKFGTLWMTG